MPPAPGVVTFPGGIILSNFAHRVFSAGVVPPPTLGSNVTHSFSSQVEMDVSFDGGLSWQSCVVSNAAAQMYLINNGPDSGDTLYGAQMLQLNVSGGTLPAGVMIRESPTKASAGETRIQPVAGGYMIDSFFDVFLEVSTDFGGTWVPASAALRLEAKPDPQLIAAAPAPRKVFPMPNGQYLSPSAWFQLYANGIVIKDVRHKLFTGWMEPPLFGVSQTQTFDSQLDFQLSTDGGYSFMAARAPATMTVQSSNTREFQGRTTYETEVTQLNISGGDLPVGVMIRESPTKASMGGNSSLAGGGGGGAGGGAAISSFFDIFTEVSIDGGGSWSVATNGPARMELERIARVYTYTNNLFPPLRGEYITSQQWWAYYAIGIVITNPSLRAFTSAISPPPPGMTTSHSFGAELEFDISYDGGLTYSHTTAPTTDSVQITCRLGGDGVTEYYDTEMTAMSIAGGGLPAGVMIRESPTRASHGRTTMSANGTDNDCDSFFDIYTEVSTDGGLSWYQTVAGPGTMILRPRTPQTALSITCPSNITVRATSPAGAVVNYTVLVSGGCSPYTTNCVPPSGSTFPIGTTVVNCSVTDVCGGQANCSFTVTVLRQLQKRFYPHNLLPPTNALYLPPAPGVVTFPGGIMISNVAHRLFSAGAVPPATPGASVIHPCTSQVELEISFNYGLTWQSCVVASAPTKIYLINRGPDSGDTLYGAELRTLNLSGGSLPAGVIIRASSTPTSSGEVRTQPIPGGYMIDSFFDIFLEISTDYGLTWMPASAPLRLEAKPDPQLIAAAAAPRKVFPMPNGQYISPTAWFQLYANGIVIKDVRHKLFTQWMEPPVFGASQTHTFDSQLDFQLSTDGGAHFIAARAPATMTVQISDQREFQGRTTYETEVTQLNISGGDLPAGVMIRESPTKASLGGNSHLAGGGGGGAGGGAAISSFFDIFTEVSTDGGGSWSSATNGPARMELERIARVYTYTNNLFPPLTGEYISPQQWWAYYANGIVFTNPSFRSFTAAVPPPTPGATITHTFGATLEGDISYDGGLTYIHTTAPLTASFQITGRLGDDGVTKYCDLEVTQFSVSGGGLPSNIQIRESPTRASLGRTTMSVNGTDYDCDSFFDIYTEVSTDGGLSWFPTVAGPGTMTLRPRTPSSPLSIVCPSNITVRATSPAGAVATYPAPIVSGGCSPYTLNCVPPTGSTFPIGTTVVNCSVTDVCGGQTNCSFTVTVLRQLQKRFYTQNLLPPTNALYLPPAPGVVSFPGGILISNVAHRKFSAGVVPPPSPGGSLIHSCVCSVEMDISFNYGLSWQSCVVSNVPFTAILTNNGPDSGDTLYGTELLQLDLGGGTLPAGVRFRESPTRASIGETRIQPTPGGYMIDSFFDVWLEISTDFGVTWVPASGSLREELKPDPALIPAVAAPRKVFPMPNGQDVGLALCQAYANGIVIRDVRHKLFTAWDEPPRFGATQSHTFDSKLDFQLSTDGGMTFAEVRASSTVTVAIKNVRGFQGRSTYDTEMTQLDVSGGDLPPILRIRESPTKASKGGTSSLAGGGGGGAGGGAAISSFFDVYTEVSTDGGLSYWPATNGPCHMELRRIAQPNPFPTNSLPPALSEYLSQQGVMYGSAYVLTNLRHHQFTDHFPPPPPGISNVHTFGSMVEFDLSQDGGHTFTPASAPATVMVKTTTQTGSDGVTEYYDSEMLQLEISGGGLPSNIYIRESPTKQSLGRTTSSGGGGGGSGGYQMDSFFDVYTEISTDGGISWQPTTSGAAEVTLSPEVLPVTPVTITGIVPSLVGIGYTIAYTGGSGSQFILLTSPTVTAPMSLWTPVATNPTTPGSFSVAPTSDTFYRIQSR